LSLEINPELVKMARANLQKAGIHNAQVRQADGAKGSPVDGPFDVIMLCGSVAEVPKTLLDQLKVGGRLVAIVGNEPIMQATVITRTGQAEFITRQPWDTLAPRLQNFPAPASFSF
jgi:protein-L-isoaspartate(D-aspartate) O-methyltransferase